MEFHQVRYFLAVSRTLNFTRAAEECHVAQPSLTRAIKLLEAELGGDLLRRERNLTHLTDLAQKLLPDLQRCYDQAVEAKAFAKTYAKSGASLRIALSPIAGLDRISAAMKRIAPQFPGLDISLHRASPTGILEKLKKGEVDLAVSDGLDGSWDRLDSWPLMTQRFVLFMHRTHALAGADPVAVSALAGERLLTLPGCTQAETLIQALGSDRITRQEIGSFEDIVTLLDANLGIAVLPSCLPLPRDLVAVDVSGLNLSAILSLYAVAGRMRSAVATALINAVRSDRSLGVQKEAQSSKDVRTERRLSATLPQAA